MTYYDIDRLRRLPLTTGLLLLTWSAAAVSIVAPANVQILGLPFSIGRPELLPIGLAVAAVYGGLRYYYYAMMLELSPYRRRRDLLDGLWAKGTKKPGLSGTYWGPIAFEGSRSFGKSSEAEAYGKEVALAFPKFAGARVTSRAEYRPGVDQDGDEYTSFEVFLNIPVRCRAAALLQDLDYSSPAWLPLSSVLLYVLRSLPNAT